MDKYIDRWRIGLIMVLLFSKFITYGQQQEKCIVRSGYYFVVQVESVLNDTITFNTIEIYSPFPKINIALSDTTSLTEHKLPHDFLKKQIRVGTLKGLKKRDINSILVLNTTLDEIDSNIIHFRLPISPKEINFKMLYPLGYNCPK